MARKKLTTYNDDSIRESNEFIYKSEPELVQEPIIIDEPRSHVPMEDEELPQIPKYSVEVPKRIRESISEVQIHSRIPIKEVIPEEQIGSTKMTLYNAYRRQKFSRDADENLAIYNKRRRGYEGKEKLVIINI